MPFIQNAGINLRMRFLRVQIEELKLARQVHMVGAVDGEIKYCYCSLSCGEFRDGHNRSADTWCAVIASKGTPWHSVEEIGCGLWVDNDPESLAKAIERMSVMSLHEMGERGQEWMKKDFSWQSVVENMTKLYREFVRLASD